MKLFVQCTTESTEQHINRPVNILTVHSMLKCDADANFRIQFNLVGKPSIYFNGINDFWIYQSVEMRNADYKALLNTEFSK